MYTHTYTHILNKNFSLICGPPKGYKLNPNRDEGLKSLKPEPNNL